MTGAGEDVEDRRAHARLVGRVGGAASVKTLQRVLRRRNLEQLRDPAKPLLGACPRKRDTCSRKHLYLNVLHGMTHNESKVEMTQVSVRQHVDDTQDVVHAHGSFRDCKE